jgi:hypothetical protein
MNSEQVIWPNDMTEEALFNPTAGGRVFVCVEKAIGEPR